MTLKQAFADYNPLSSPHWQEVPLSRLRNVALAIMLSSSTAGFVMDIVAVTLSRRSVLPIGIWSGIPVGLLFGLGATAQILSKTRKQHARFFALIGLTITTAIFVSYVIAITGNMWQALPSKKAGVAILVDCISLLLCTVLGYNFFLKFVNREGMNYARAEAELQHAYRIQSTLVPPVIAQSAVVEVFGRSRPSEQVGGDLVDIVRLSDSSVFAYLADISGHGLNAGILMGMYKTAVRVGLQARQDTGSLLSLLNEVMPAMKDPAMYATFACLHFSEQRLEYALAGHPAILRYNASTGQVQSLAMKQFPVGLVASAQFSVTAFSCQRGDLFVLASDGILDVTNYEGEEFGLSRLGEIVYRSIAKPLPDIYEAVTETVRQYGRQEDDQSLLLARVVGSTVDGHSKSCGAEIGGLRE
jgi:hypothetical protein